MPFKTIELTNANAINEQPAKLRHFYKGFSSLSANPGSRLYDMDLVKQDIINHFNTKKGSRVMNPNFGSIVWDLLMEPLTDGIRQQLVDDIQNICGADPRVQVLQIDITEYDQGYLLELTLNFPVTNQSANLKLNFNQEIGLTVMNNSVTNKYNIPG
jgi:phage baseplate assembly protein W